MICLALILVPVMGNAPAYAFTSESLFSWFFGEDEDSSSDGYSNKAGKESGASDETSDSKGLSRKAGEDSDYYETLSVEEGETYDTADEVCAYLVLYQELPENYMTKKEARNLGWEGGALNRTVSGKCIGGDVFGNYEQILPEKEDRIYHECDIDTLNSSGRGAERIVYSGDDDSGEWNIYYTDDHYETFVLLWGEDDYE